MEQDFQTRLNKTLTEIKNMKMNQIVGGDSWVVYRTEVVFTTSPNREYILRFSPESSQPYVAVAKVTSPDRVIYGSIGDFFPHPNLPGIWFRPFQFNSSNTVAQTFFVYSTVKGTVSMEDVTGKDAGTTA